MLYAIDVSDLPENAWHQALDVECTCNIRGGSRGRVQGVRPPPPPSALR